MSCGRNVTKVLINNLPPEMSDVSPAHPSITSHCDQEASLWARTNGKCELHFTHTLSAENPTLTCQRYGSGILWSESEHGENRGGGIPSFRINTVIWGKMAQIENAGQLEAFLCCRTTRTIVACGVLVIGDIRKAYCTTNTHHELNLLLPRGGKHNLGLAAFCLRISQQRHMNHKKKKTPNCLIHQSFWKSFAQPATEKKPYKLMINYSQIYLIMVQDTGTRIFLETLVLRNPATVKFPSH